MPQQSTLFGPDEKRFRTVVMDPPWSCEAGAGENKRGADRHYDLLKPRQIGRLIQQDCDPWQYLADNAHLYLWTTSAALAKGHAHFVARSLGFEPTSVLSWTKKREDGGKQLGLGFYFRFCTEYILFCTRGDTLKPAPEDKQPTTIEAPRTEHSSKPEASYELIEQTSPAEYLEIFARQEREGWTCWGDEV